MMDHVSMLNFEELYASACAEPERARRFVRCVRAINASVCAAKIALHRAGRLVSLSDQIQTVAAGRPGLSIMFLVFAAEAVGKLVRGFEGEGQSKRHVRVFFEEICSDRARLELAQAFSRVADEALDRSSLSQPVLNRDIAAVTLPFAEKDREKLLAGARLSVREAVDYLYEIRCEVAHAGDYASYCLRDDTRRTMLLTPSQSGILVARISLDEIRRIVLVGGLRGALGMLPDDHECRSLPGGPSEEAG